MRRLEGLQSAARAGARQPKQPSVDDFDAQLADAHQSVVALCHYISECVDLDGCLDAVNQWIALTEQKPHCLDELQEVATCFDAGLEECYGSQLITSCDLAESQFRGCLDS